jgi:hypothetical protein
LGLRCGLDWKQRSELESAQQVAEQAKAQVAGLEQEIEACDFG